MLDRPWRWILELVVSAFLLGVLNALVKALGASAFLGIGWAGRAALLIAITLILDRVIIPSPEQLDRGDPMPPLPTHQPDSRRRSWSERTRAQ